MFSYWFKFNFFTSNDIYIKNFDPSTISLMYWVATLGLAWLIHMLEKRLGKGDDK